MGQFNISEFLFESDGNLFLGDTENLSFQDFLLLVGRRYVYLQERGLRGKRVGLPYSLPIVFLTDFFALSCLDCEVVLLPPHNGNDFDLDHIVADFNMGAFAKEKLSLSWEDSRFVVLTSGSEGGPKGVVHNWRNLREASQGFKQSMDLKSLTWGHSIPLYHVAGLMSFFRPFFLRESYVVTGDFNLKAQLAAGTHVLSLVPTQLFRLAQAGELALLKKLQLLLVGGAPLGETLKSQLQALGVRFLESYGLTEMMATVACSGEVLPGREVRIGSDGVIGLKGQGMFLHYLGDEGPALQNGFFITQDLGQWDEQGKLRILGRKDNVFQCGGENVNPHLIEQALLRVLGVHEAIVVAREDPEYGFVPWAFIRASSLRDEEYYQQQLRGQLPRLLIPRKFLSLAQEGLDLKPSRAKLKEWIKAQ